MLRYSLALIVAAAYGVLCAAAPAGAVISGPVAVFWNFHRISNTSSWLEGVAQDTGDGSIIIRQTWRAGSGQNTDECDSATYDKVGGWLPRGWYTLLGHYDHYDGSKIKGRVWRWEDKRCNGGTGVLRTELFTHSEETAANGQYCPNPYDDPFCWEGDHDYYSNGCIKLAHAQPYPSDVAQAHTLWDGYDGHHGDLWLGRRLYVY
jgi:hypothetical protein